MVNHTPRGYGIARAGLACLVLLGGCDFNQNRKVADAGFQRFHSQVEFESYWQVYSEADPEFREMITQDDFTRLLQSVRVRLGRPQRSNVRSYMEGCFTDRGLLARVVYDVQFERAHAEEHFVWRLREGRPFLLGYHVSSPAMGLEGDDTRR
jgi:hypothetical protein